MNDASPTPSLSDYHSDLIRRLEKIQNNVWDETDKRVIALEDLCGALNLLRSQVHFIQDSARLDWLSTHRRPGIVRLSFDGETISRGDGVRAAIDAAMQTGGAQ